ncbi:hypothetical protein D6810_00450 [Candidatus Dojkabacteria bacterium]|uniref:Uncharacterized protein n=1 Tax=Candidatus Dojkabacteria bacterium TaxID=2099670 RepID=A0A3M0Z1J6_9BACT|nr:MAG: hypothetical protein D6810_00450 [Candidatus Dojkabacteria bacterium]
MIQNFLLKALEGDFGSSLFNILVVYIISIWFLLCFWVFRDAKKRYSSLTLAILFSLLVLLLNIPALIFYLIVRPESESDYLLVLGDRNVKNEFDGVNIPIVKFTGEDGVNIVLNIRVDNGKTENKKLPKVAMNLEIAEGDSDFEIEKDLPNLSKDLPNLSDDTEKRGVSKRHVHKIFESVPRILQTVKGTSIRRTLGNLKRIVGSIKDKVDRFELEDDEEQQKQKKKSEKN